jgi:mandelate racemase
MPAQRGGATRFLRPAGATGHEEGTPMSLQKLTLRSVEVRPVVVPLGRPIVARVGSFAEWPFLLVDLATEEGVTGHAYLQPYLAKTMAPLGTMIGIVAEAWRGKRLAPVEMFDAGRQSLNLAGLEGMALSAVAAVDMAAWDALARAAGVPLAVLLGGTVAPVRAYNSNGLWLAPPETLGEQAQALLAEGGFAAVKLRLGRPRDADDLAAVRAVRDAVGDDAIVMSDFNQGLSMGQALQRCHALDGEGLYWFEEPLVYDNIQGYAQLRREIATPIQLGENFWGPRELHKALAASAGDYVMPDFMRIGGITGWLRAAAIAGAAGIEVSSHLYPEVAAHVLRVTETAHWLEWTDWANLLLAEPYAVQDGHVVIPDRPGLGLDWDEAAVQRYRADL